MPGAFRVHIEGPTSHPVIVLHGDCDVEDGRDVVAIATGIRLTSRWRITFDVTDVTFPNADALSMFRTLLDARMEITIWGAPPSMMALFDEAKLTSSLRFEAPPEPD